MKELKMLLEKMTAEELKYVVQEANHLLQEAKKEFRPEEERYQQLVTEYQVIYHQPLYMSVNIPLSDLPQPRILFFPWHRGGRRSVAMKLCADYIADLENFLTKRPEVQEELANLNKRLNWIHEEIGKIATETQEIEGNIWWRLARHYQNL